MRTSFRSFLLMLALTGVLHAQFVEDAVRYSNRGYGTGARAAGMGFASIGVSDDFSASVHNPAGLAQMRRLEVVGSLGHAGLTNDATYLGASSSDDVSVTALENIGFVFPYPTVQGSLVFAFGYNRLADLSGILSAKGYNGESSIIPTLYDGDPAYDIPFNTYLTNTNGYTAVQKDVRQTVRLKEDGSIGQWSFSGAVDVEENLSIGVSLNILNGDFSSVRNFLEEDVNNVYNNAVLNLPRDSAYLRFNKFYYDSYISSEVSGTGLTVGLMYRGEEWRVGATVKTPSAVTVKETYSNEGQSVFDFAGSWQGGTAPVTSHSYKATNEYGVSTPWAFGAGVSLYVLPSLLVAADVEHTDWTQTKWTDSDALEKGNSALQAQFRAVTAFRAGAEFDVPGTVFRLRAGYARTPSPYAGDASSSDRVLYTGGLGMFLQRNVMLDAAAGYGTAETYTYQYVTSLHPGTARTDQSLTTLTLGFTLSYRF